MLQTMKRLLQFGIDIIVPIVFATILVCVVYFKTQNNGLSSPVVPNDWMVDTTDNGSISSIGTDGTKYNFIKKNTEEEDEGVQNEHQEYTVNMNEATQLEECINALNKAFSD